MGNGQAVSDSGNAWITLREKEAEKMKFVYPARIRKTETGKFHAEFPDLEGCTAEADDLEDVLEKAKEAEYNWISVELEEEHELPARTELADLKPSEGEIVRDLSATVKFFEGWEE